MYYTVNANFKPETAAEFYRRLMDGTIRSQKPDGNEIVESMERARIDDAGVVRWSEVCYCPTPLKHERETVYDEFFTDIETQEVDGYVALNGEELMDYLARLSD